MTDCGNNKIRENGMNTKEGGVKVMMMMLMDSKKGIILLNRAENPKYVK